jgi:hypothetical protein
MAKKPAQTAAAKAAQRAAAAKAAPAPKAAPKISKLHGSLTYLGAQAYLSYVHVNGADFFEELDTTNLDLTKENLLVKTIVDTKKGTTAEVYLNLTK